jgi:predicted DNA-binding transcriptional regulator AlpA
MTGPINQLRLLKRTDVLRLTGVSYPTLWAWMCAGKFPRARIIGNGKKGRSHWRSDEVEAWLNNLPTRRLKGDAT